MNAGSVNRLVAHSDAARETNAESRRDKCFPGEAGLYRSTHGPRLNRGQDDQPAERIGRLLRVLWEVPIDLNQFLPTDCGRFNIRGLHVFLVLWRLSGVPQYRLSRVDANLSIGHCTVYYVVKRSFLAKDGPSVEPQGFTACSRPTS